MIERLVLGTHNTNKRREIEQLLAKLDIAILTLNDFPAADDVVEDGDTFQANAEKKATQQAKRLGEFVVGEDSGLCVAALGGAPGIYSARYAGEEAIYKNNNAKLVAEMKEKNQRDAYYVCHVALASPQGEIIFNTEQTCHGRIVDEPRGDGGFGYDPYFEIPEYGLTMAELGDLFKSVISHRARSMRDLVSYLSKNRQPKVQS